MELNITLLGQCITFAVFIWFTMKFVWPPIIKAMEERKQKIADGLAAGERGQRDLELAQHKATEIIRDAKIEATHIIEDSNKRASQIVEASKEKARQEGARIIALGKAEIDRELQKGKQSLKNQIAVIALNGAEKVLGHTVDKAANSELIDKLIAEL